MQQWRRVPYKYSIDHLSILIYIDFSHFFAQPHDIFDVGVCNVEAAPWHWIHRRQAIEYVLPFPKLDISRFACDFGQKYAQVDEANHVLIFHRPTYTPFSISVCLIVCYHQHFTLFFVRCSFRPLLSRRITSSLWAISTHGFSRLLATSGNTTQPGR